MAQIARAGIDVKHFLTSAAMEMVVVVPVRLIPGGLARQ
jgi:hypothetical protein